MVFQDLCSTGNKIGEIWPDFYVVWALFPGFGVKESIFGVKKPKCEAKKSQKTSGKEKKKKKKKRQRFRKFFN